jgi:hypothetical protein
MFSIPSSLVPYSFWVKLIGALLIIGAIAGGGYKIGSATAHNTDNKGYQDLQNKMNTLQKQYDNDKVSWQKTIAQANTDAATAIIAKDKQNKADLDAKNAQIVVLQGKYQTTLKEVQNAKQAAIHNVVNPVVSADPATDGMWVDVDTTTCTNNNPNSNSTVSQPPSSGSQSIGTNRCRLSEGTAERLIDHAAEANEIVAKLNQCSVSLKTVIQPSDSQKTEVTVDPNRETE